MLPLYPLFLRQSRIRAEILSGIERGMEDVRADRGVDFDDLLAEWDAKLASA